jgi:hypothetical protein
MKQIEHTVFAEPESARIRSPFWALIFPPTDRRANVSGYAGRRRPSSMKPVGKT